MKRMQLALSVCTTLCAPIMVGTSAAQNAQWSATSSPVQSTIAGGPWTLGQGGTSTGGGAYNGSSLTLDLVTVSGNTATGGAGGDTNAANSLGAPGTGGLGGGGSNP